MFVTRQVLSTIVLSAVAFCISGCTGAQRQHGHVGEPSDDGHAHASHDHGNDAHGAGNQQIEKALAELSADDRALAEKQKVCLVSDEALGSMGKPMKLDVQGQSVFICCEGCKDALTEAPGKYLAKLKK